MESLLRKKVLLIGATGGIGAEVAQLMINSSAELFITGRNTEKLEALAQQLELPATHVFVLDITDAEAVQRVAQTIHNFLDAPIDILINAAGIGIIKPFEQLTSDDFNQTIDINLKGSFHVLQAFLPPMKRTKKGLIMHIPGVLGKAPMAGASLYAASKYGLNGMLKSLREELKRTEIRITNLYLGGVDSPFWDTIDMKVRREKFITAKEAAKAIWFLAQQPKSGPVAEMVIQPFNHQVI